MKNEAKQPRMLHGELQNAQNQQKTAWDRLPGEPANWYFRARRYFLLGHGRSVEAVLREEREAQTGTGGRKKRGVTDSVVSSPDTDTDPVKKVSITVPGSWKRAAAQWQWKERASHFDEYLRMESRKEVMSHLDTEAQYIVKAQRLDVLDTLMKNLMRLIKDIDFTVKDPRSGTLINYPHWLALHRQALNTLKAIRLEMEVLEPHGATSFNQLSEEGRL